jgi:tetratricopeptide (TPR) repeat protein
MNAPTTHPRALARASTRVLAIALAMALATGESRADSQASSPSATSRAPITASTSGTSTSGAPTTGRGTNGTPTTGKATGGAPTTGAATTAPNSTVASGTPPSGRTDRPAAASEARAHVDRATELHARGKYAGALAELGTAYTLEARPELLYAMAQLHVKLEDCPQAVGLYERFLASRPAPAAQADATEAIARCRARHVERATRMHGERRYADALAALTRAYVDDPQPALLYAIAQVHVKLGDCGRATLYYERYLATNPLPRSQAAAREAIEACHEMPPAEREPGTVTTAAPLVAVNATVRKPRPWYRDRWAAAFGAGGATLAIAGLATYSAGRGNLVAATTATDIDRHDELARRGRRQRAVALGLGAGALALTGAAITRYVLAGRAEHVDIAAPAGGGTGAVLAWGRTF